MSMITANNDFLVPLASYEGETSHLEKKEAALTEVPVARVSPSSPHSHAKFLSYEDGVDKKIPVTISVSVEQVGSEEDSTWSNSTDVPIYRALVNDKTASGELALDDNGHAFIKAPQLFYGTTLSVNIAGRTAEEKEANRAVAQNFHEALDEFFGEEIMNHLYPPEEQKKLLATGAPLTTEKARSIIEKGFEMINAIAGYCEQHATEDPNAFVQSLVPVDRALGVARYAQEEIKKAATDIEQQSSKEHLADALSHSFGIVSGSILAGIAVMATGHLSPSDYFFIADLMSNKALSKTVEHYVVQAILWRLGDNPKNAHARSVIEDYGRSYLPGFVTSTSVRTIHLEITEDSPSSAAHVIDTALGVGSNIEGIGLGSGHSRLFRMGVMSLVDGLKGLQKLGSEPSAAHDKLAAAQAAFIVTHQYAVTLAQQSGDLTKLALANDMASKALQRSVSQPKQIKIPPWRRGI